MRRRSYGAAPIFVAMVLGAFLWQASSVQGGVTGPCGVGGNDAGPACVDLEWRPAQQTVFIGEVVEIGLYAISVNNYHQPIDAIDFIPAWDPNALQIMLPEDPCTSFDPCFVCPTEAPPDVPATYNWLNSCYPDDSGLDGLNQGCESGTCCIGSPPPNVPDNDGAVFYQAISQIICNNESAEPARATPAISGGLGGLLVTKFRFLALESGMHMITIAPDCEFVGEPPGCFAETRVLGGAFPGDNTLGSIGPPAIVEVSDCQPPTVGVAGSRYVAVTPAAGPALVGIHMTGLGDVGCLSGYVTSDGRLVPGGPINPLAPGVDGWGTKFVRGFQLIAGKSFEVRTDCDPDNPGTSFSDPVEFTLWRMGDTNDDGIADFRDIGFVVDGFRNSWAYPWCCDTDADCAFLGASSVCAPTQPECESPNGQLHPGRCTKTVEMLDIIGGGGGISCFPDGLVDFADISIAVDAFRNLLDPCRDVGCR